MCFQFLCSEKIMLDTCQLVFESNALISTQVNLQGRKIFLISIKLLVELTNCRWMTKNLCYRVTIKMLSHTTLMATFKCSCQMVSITCQDMVSSSDPWEKERCERSNCLPCKGSDEKPKVSCQKENITYCIRCTECSK